MINAIKVGINGGHHCSQVLKNTNVPLILKVWDFMFFSWEKHITSHFFPSPSNPSLLKSAVH
jgi:hypothetical protein